MVTVCGIPQDKSDITKLKHVATMSSSFFYYSSYANMITSVNCPILEHRSILVVLYSNYIYLTQVETMLDNYQSNLHVHICDKLFHSS